STLDAPSGGVAAPVWAHPVWITAPIASGTNVITFDIDVLQRVDSPRPPVSNGAGGSWAARF
ncbi:MAG: hypothetical protein KDA28_09770, partial [Phycisphaerales bacterium]|nr:hypothetical protein [Phycisphaerales bacterium]